MGKRTKAKKVGQEEPSWKKKSFNSIRQLQTRNIKNTFLIYCEGENTEPAYFDSFPVTTETKVEAIGLARSRMALIKKVIDLVGKIKDRDENEQIWCVFDRDLGRNKSLEEINEENQDFNNAVFLAERKGIKVAYSNDSFELWFVIHQQYIEAAMHRDQYFEILSKTFGFNYEKAGKEKDFAKKIYATLQNQQKTAIEFAKKLNEKHKDLPTCDRNPCTTVHLLVEELNKCLRT